MRIIDRYVLGMFIRNYLISFMVLIGMYVALDLVFNFANLTQSKGASLAIPVWRELFDIARFYFYQSFEFFVFLSGMIAVVAAAFTLMRLSRFNETTALLAAGTPLLRVAVSVILAGAVLNFVLLPIDQEILLPRFIPELIRQHGEIHDETARPLAVNMMQDKYDGLFNAAMYIPSTPRSPAHVEFLDVIERGPDLRPISHLYATRAIWNQKLRRWDLVDGRRVSIAPPDQKTNPAVETNVAYYQSDLTPEEIAVNRGKDYIQLLPTRTISELLSRNRYGTIDLLRTKHMRFTQPITNLILLLLTISTVLTRTPGTLKTAAVRCTILTGLCMTAIFVCFQLAGAPPIGASISLWSALMAWLPIFIFGPMAVYLLDHVKS
jgi:lipopolysaccharide export LptBFGC system permease protein LptF